MKCRFCSAPLSRTFCDLGRTPLSNSYLSKESQTGCERFYPLHALVCDKCFLVQVCEFEKPEAIFSDYSYFSSYSDSWLDHVRKYTQEMISRFGLNERSQVIEIASNDGYLLQFFLENKIPILGIEPARNVAAVARAKGIPTLTEFFGARFAQEQHLKGDLVIANNVLAHVPDLNDFVEGIQIALAQNGVATLEFPHLLKLIQENQFDTIYHEHFSYFSFYTVEKVFSQHGLRIFDVESIPTHGGSLRIYGCRQNDASKPNHSRVLEMREREKQAGLLTLDSYLAFDKTVQETKIKLRNLLIRLKNEGKRVAAYGAPAKGNTLLNYCGIRTDLIEYTVDRSPHKQNKLLPGSHIPIYSPDRIKLDKPNYILVLPWNLKDEIVKQLYFVKDWGCKFIVPIPEPAVLP